MGEGASIVIPVVDENDGGETGRADHHDPGPEEAVGPGAGERVQAEVLPVPPARLGRVVLRQIGRVDVCWVAAGVAARLVVQAAVALLLALQREVAAEAEVGRKGGRPLHEAVGARVGQLLSEIDHKRCYNR